LISSYCTYGGYYRTLLAFSVFLRALCGENLPFSGMNLHLDQAGMTRERLPYDASTMVVPLRGAL
jgi:hypothetical protein